MDLRILLLFTAAVTVCIADDASETTEDGLLCASNYLKEKHLLDSKFRVKISPSNVSAPVCSQFIDTFKKNFYEAMDKEIRADKDLAEVADCLNEKSQEGELADLAFKIFVYRGSSTLSKTKQKKAMRAFEQAIEKKTETLVKICAATKTFGELFDGLCKAITEDSSSESEEDSPLEDYCIMKYLTENNIINTTIHHIDLNPKNVDVTGADCNKMVKKAKSDAISVLKKEFDEEDDFQSRPLKKCLKKTLNGSRYFEIAGKAAVLCEVTMTPEVKEFERGQFIEGIAKIYEAIYQC